MLRMGMFSGGGLLAGLATQLAVVLVARAPYYLPLFFISPLAVSMKKMILWIPYPIYRLLHWKAFRPPFQQLAEELKPIPGCPQDALSLQVIARDLRKICIHQAEAESLVELARLQWWEWRGTAGLMNLLAWLREREQRGRLNKASITVAELRKVTANCHGSAQIYFCTGGPPPLAALKLIEIDENGDLLLMFR